MATDKTRTVCIMEIAHELGLSTRTVSRYHARKLKTLRAGGSGIPYKMRKVDLDRLKRGK